MLTVEDLSRELQIRGALAYPWPSKARHGGTALDVACASKSATWRGTSKDANPKRRLHPRSVRGTHSIEQEVLWGALRERRQRIEARTHEG
jgi:hypothetical protein